MRQSSFSVGTEYPAEPEQRVHACTTSTTTCSRRSRTSAALDAQGNEVYVIGNPGSGLAAITPVARPHAAVRRRRRPKRQYDALELGYSSRFSNNYFFSANYTLSRLYGNYAGLASSDEIRTPTTGVSSAVAQQQAGSISREGGNVNRAWDLDEILFDSHGNLDVLGRLATDRPHAVKLYGAYDFPFGTQIGGFFYGAQRHADEHLRGDHATRSRSSSKGRGDMGRTPVLTRTDLLLSHELTTGRHEAAALRVQRAQPVQPEDDTSHLQLPEQGRGRRARQSSAIDLSQHRPARRATTTTR